MDASIDIVRRIIPATETYFVVSSGACAAATSFLARTSGLDATHQSAYVSLICGLVSDGVWSKLDTLYVFATQDQTTAKLNLVSSSFGITEQGSPTWTVNSGYTGDSGSMYLDTGFVANSAGGNYTQSSASYGTYNIFNNTGTGNTVIMGAFDGGNNLSDLLPLQSASTVLARINSIGAAGASGATDNNRMGMYVVSRTTSSQIDIYKNGAIKATNAGDTSQSIAGLPSFFIMARNDSGSPSSFVSDKPSAAFIGGGLSATDALNLSTRLNIYMTTFGINVY